MQQQIPVPLALVQTTYNFHTSGLRMRMQKRNIASPASISELSYRLVNLGAAFKTGIITDPRIICETALGIDDDLETFRAGIPWYWGYTTVDATDAPTSTFFDGKRYVYPNLWIAEVWNNWRTLRILINQIILQSELRVGMSDDAQRSLELIHRFCAELCISIASFADSPRKSISVRVALQDLHSS